MSAFASRRPLQPGSTGADRLLTIGVLAIAALASLALSTRGPHDVVLFILVSLGVFALAVLFVSPRYEISLAILMVYLGAIDGYFKLRSGVQGATLGRDALLYAVALGAFIRVATKKHVLLPPYSGWIVLFAAVCVVQIFNPVAGSKLHSLAGVRPHLEFVPLFFFGFAVMRTKQRLRAFLMILLVLTAINAVVALYQYTLTPAQFASWGPGYHKLIFGSQELGARVSFGANGVTQVRPFGLGSDIGFSGSLAALGAPAVLALLALGKSRPRLWVSIPLAASVVIALIASQARISVIATGFALIAFAALSSVSGRRIQILLGVLAVLLASWLAVSLISQNIGAQIFQRYRSIAPANVVETTFSYKAPSFAALYHYFGTYPLGAGIGRTGPASGFVGAAAGLNVENQFNYLLLELGLPGLIVFCAFMVAMSRLAITRVRNVVDPETRILLIALSAGFIGVFASFAGAPVMASPPDGPYVWFVAGILVYWLSPLRGRPAGNPSPGR